MRDEALIHFHYGQSISVGIHLQSGGSKAVALIDEAMPFFDSRSPGRCVAGFCAKHAHLVEDILSPPPIHWQSWRFIEWDQWFGRLHGVFLVDMANFNIKHYPLYRSSPIMRKGDFSRLPRRLYAVGE